MDFFGFHPLYVVILLALALIIFGPSRLPKMGAQVGRMLREFQAAREGLTQQMREAFEEEPDFGPSSGPTVAVADPEPPSEPAASTDTAVAVADRPLGETVAAGILDRPIDEATAEALAGTGAPVAEPAAGQSTPEIDLAAVTAPSSPAPEAGAEEGPVLSGGETASAESSTAAAVDGPASEAAPAEPEQPAAALAPPQVAAPDESEPSAVAGEPPVHEVVPGAPATGGVVVETPDDVPGPVESVSPPPAEGAIPFASVAADHDPSTPSRDEESRPE